jgi:hypothetical protein
MKTYMFWDITRCYPLHDLLLVGLFFGPEDGDDIYLRNGSLLSVDYNALYPRR